MIVGLQIYTDEETKMLKMQNDREYQKYKFCNFRTRKETQTLAHSRISLWSLDWPETDASSSSVSSKVFLKFLSSLGEPWKLHVDI